MEIKGLNFAGNAINHSRNVPRVKAMAFNRNQLPASGKALLRINAVDNSESLCLVAGLVVVGAPSHGLLDMLSVANAESKVDLGRSAWCNGAHSSSDLVLGVASENDIFLKIAFKVHSKAIESDLSEGKLGKRLTLLVLGRPGINPEGHLATVVDHRRRKTVKDGCVGAGHGDLAVLGEEGQLALEALELLGVHVIIRQAHLVGHPLKVVEGLVRRPMQLHDRGGRVLEFSTTRVRAEGDIL